MKRHCPYCGHYEFRYGHAAIAQNGDPICPTCDMTPGEHAYRARILADSAGVYAEELRAFNAERAAGLIPRAS